ncbi:MAG: hypothetical protein KME19_08005 [Microcoleus vaginatus WJT46-NPBG5]|nr:hypothetical protein [Microcoleus vaginatus WJT46-NPBG5]
MVKNTIAVSAGLIIPVCPFLCDHTQWMPVDRAKVVRQPSCVNSTLPVKKNTTPHFDDNWNMKVVTASTPPGILDF